MLALISLVGLKAETTIYVGGVITDGFDSEPVYWRNGVFNKMFPEGAVPNGSFMGMAVENGIIYSCFKEGSYSSYINIYKSGTKIYSFSCEDNENYESMAVLNGNVYVVLYHNQSQKYYIIKNGNKKPAWTYERSNGKYICTENGILYYSRHTEYYDCRNRVFGYYVGGMSKEFGSTCSECIDATNMRVINGNIYFTGYNKIQGNEKGSIYKPNGFDGWIYDVAAADVFYYIGIPRDSKKRVLYNWNGINLLGASPEYEPLKIIGRGGKLFILANKKVGSTYEKVYITYTPSTNTLYSTQLTSSYSAYITDFYVENK